MVKVTINANGAIDSLNNMDAKFQERVAMAAIDRAAKKTMATVRAAMIADGLGGGAERSKNGWSWTVVGRLVASVKTSRKWKRSQNTVVGRKVFNSRAKTRLASERAPHAHLIVLGHRKFIPTGVPGKGNVRPAKNFMAQPRPSYAAAFAFAPALLVAESKRALNNAVRRINRKKGRL